MDDDQTVRLVTSDDVSDTNPEMQANHIRSLQREMRAGNELIAMRLDRLEKRDERIELLLADLLALYQKQAELHAALDENAMKRRKAARK